MNLDDPEINSFKIHVSWSTKVNHQHEVLQSHDQVLTAIVEALRDRAEKQKQEKDQRQTPKQDRAAQARCTSHLAVFGELPGFFRSMQDRMLISLGSAY